MKQIDLSKTLYDLTEEYPELVAILPDMGFAGVAVPEMRETHGRLMTIPSGCEKLGIDLAEVLERLRAHGFEAKP